MKETALLLAALLGICANIRGVEPLKSADEIFDFSNAKMTNCTTWSADFSQTMNMFGGHIASKGQITHKSPMQMRMSMEMPMIGQDMKMLMTTVLGRDGIMWQEADMGGTKRVTKIDMNQAMSNLVTQLGLKTDPLKALDPSQQWERNREMFDYTVTGTGQLHGQPVYVLEGTWKAAARTNRQVAMIAAFTGKTRLYIGQQDGFVHKMEQFDRSNANLFMTMEMSNLKFNEDLLDKMFTYHPPPEVQIMDMTQMAGAILGGQSISAGSPPPPSPAPAEEKSNRPTPAQ
jgi:outer membrane lipoprotein-sorting protein